MKKFVVAFVLALVAGLALALELPEQSAVVVTDASGSVVGFGAYQDGSLELSVSEEASGFLTLSFTTGSGEVVTVEVMVSQDGSLVGTETMSDLAAEVGGSTEISYASSAEIDAAVEDGLVVAAEAAGEHGAEGRAVAESARDAQGAPDLSGLPGGGPDDAGTEEEDSEEEAQGESGASVAGEVAGEVAGDIVGATPSAPSKP